jgi:hypothetical protein
MAGVFRERNERLPTGHIHDRGMRGRFDQCDRVLGVVFVNVPFALGDDLAVGGFQAPVPLAVAGRCSDFIVHDVRLRFHVYWGNTRTQSRSTKE